jgi:hypothetical protein
VTLAAENDPKIKDTFIRDYLKNANLVINTTLLKIESNQKEGMHSILSLTIAIPILEWINVEVI